MNKAQLVEAVAAKSNATKTQTKDFLDAFVDTVMQSVANGETVELLGFGTFKAKDRAEKKGRNPATGETITIPAKKAPAFVVGKKFKAIVNK